MVLSPLSFRPWLPSPARWAAAWVIVLGATGCVTVKPSQRQHLSKPEMSPESDVEEESFQTHVEAAREGSMGGHGAAGGGCGCG